MSRTPRTRVLIAGGGVAAVEAVLALAEAAGDLVNMTVLSPQPDLELRPLAVAVPFAASTERRHFPLTRLCDQVGATLVTGTLAEVRGKDRQVIAADGTALPYDALIVAVGARALPPYPHALTFGSEPLVLSRLLSDVEQGTSRRIAFVVPPGVAWPLPAYEIALMTRREAREMGVDPEITLITPEDAPLAVFGAQASAKLAELLAAARIETRTGAHAEVGPSGRIGLAPSGETLEFQRVVALPHLVGPGIPGLPHDDDGFVGVDGHMRVRDMRDVYCVGDAADYPLKQGGLATQQADVAALHVAALAGAAVTTMPFRPVLRGRLMTGAADQFFEKSVQRPGGRQSAEPLWWPPTKVAGRLLTPWIAEQDPDAVPPPPRKGAAAVEVELPDDPGAARRAILSLAPLGAPFPVHRS